MRTACMLIVFAGAACMGCKGCDARRGVATLML